MRETTPHWQHGVVLVCTNERADSTRASCGLKTGTRLRRWLKEAARAEGGAAAQCRVLATSCLDECPEKGVAVAFMPGDRLLTVDPETDRDALLAEMRSHFSTPAAEGVRGFARRALGRVRPKKD